MCHFSSSTRRSGIERNENHHRFASKIIIVLRYTLKSNAINHNCFLSISFCSLLLSLVHSFIYSFVQSVRLLLNFFFVVASLHSFNISRVISHFISVSFSFIYFFRLLFSTFQGVWSSYRIHFRNDLKFKCFMYLYALRCDYKF